MAETQKMHVPFPEDGDTAWYDQFRDGTMAALDAALYAAREDRNLFLVGGGMMSFVTEIFAWSAVMRLISFQNAFGWTINPHSLTVLDGQIVFAVIARGPETNNIVMLQVGYPPVPFTSANNAIVICVRLGDRLYFRNGLVLIDGDNLNLIERGGRS